MTYTRTLLRAAVVAAGATLLPSAASAQSAPPPQFAMCKVCHKTTDKAPSAIGPTLWRVGGRKAGTLPGYAYSPAMKQSDLVWDRKTLMAFLAKPRTVVPGTKMAYAGTSDPKAAAALADYLLGLK
ncbi:c-type cytochrome [Novosphingobium resinovorum]|uniref:Cytochrome C n=1 Tax=Novosphingobium resinovorum TaxID=158500 RepID=A0A1D8A2Z1_9SPHN|nr:MULTISPECIES: c-type cytochrome [Sphingomonadaceae]AOR76464.1 cytochrome C [Novosphingobium resinovorum]EJU14580.1 class I cytochrome c [Sphingomonas sp. LH128]MBF7011721.1 c-type cytochrome [Novosphingobium sp. HR1a]WJM26474.1 c-type cytochrome [Novosphingobium resinovorum]